MNDTSTMKKGRCIKCRSNEVYVNDSKWGQYGNYQSNTIPIAVFSNAILKNYVCTNCGYAESYIEDKAKLEKVKQRWSKVSSTQDR